MIETRHHRAPDEIARTISGRVQPMLFRDTAPFVKFCENWSLEKVAQAVTRQGDKMVRVVKGNRETQSTTFEQRSLNTFLSHLLLDGAGARDALYLKEFPLDQLSPDLPLELNKSSYIGARHIFSSAWIGGGATSTGTHYDIFDNLMFQVQGRKIMHLAPPPALGDARHSRKYDFCARLADAQLSNNGRADTIRVEVGGGDMLYIPKGWWHQIENGEASFTISGFHTGLPRLLWRGGAEGARHLLHCLNPYKSNCTCHEK